MQVDTGAFAALTDQVAELAEQVRQLAVKEVSAEAFFQAGFATGETRAREAMLGRAAGTSQAPRPRSGRPAHLRAVDGGQP